MGRNQNIRKKIAGHLEAISGHEEKIHREFRKSRPDRGLIRKWEKTIANARAQVEKLQDRLRGRK